MTKEEVVKHLEGVVQYLNERSNQYVVGRSGGGYYFKSVYEDLVPVLEYLRGSDE